MGHSEVNEEGVTDRDELVSLLVKSPFVEKQKWRVPDEPLKLDGFNWTPDLVGEDGRALVLITGDHVPLFLRRRLLAAAQAGHAITCALDITALTSADVVPLLSEIDAGISLLRDGTFSSPLPLLKFIGAEEIAVSRDVRCRLFESGLRRCRAVKTAALKGKTLEWLLHFLFSQVQDFRVKVCNYRTESEELDLVVQLNRIDGARCWSHLNAPFLVVEAKNRENKQGQEIVSKLNTIISVKRGTCKIGFIISLSGFTSDAQTQVLKLASEERILVLMDADALCGWASAEDFDGALNDIVMGAALN